MKSLRGLVFLELASTVQYRLLPPQLSQPTQIRPLYRQRGSGRQSAQVSGWADSVNRSVVR